MTAKQKRQTGWIVLAIFAMLMNVVLYVQNGSTIALVCALVALLALVVFTVRWPPRPDNTFVTKVEDDGTRAATDEFGVSYKGEDPFENSPFNRDVIRKGDPGWEIFEAAMKHGVVSGEYDADGRVVNIKDKDGNEVEP